MESWKEKVPFIIAAITFVAICALAYYLTIVRKVNYFTRIDNTEVSQNAKSEYQYKLRAYDEHGKIHDVEFTAYKELREDAFLKLEVMSLRGVVSWEEIQYDELPYDVKSRYEQP